MCSHTRISSLLLECVLLGWRRAQCYQLAHTQCYQLAHMTTPALPLSPKKMFFGAVIGISFIASLVETELQPKKDSMLESSLWMLEMIFVCIFSGECCSPRCSFLTHRETTDTHTQSRALSLSLSLTRVCARFLPLSSVSLC